MHNRKVAYDCRHFRGDRPCRWHKREGLVCECERYSPVRGNLLIIKLDAVGDVLRTTCLLPAIAKKWPGLRVSWITRPDAIPLLESNPYLAEAVAYGPDALVHLGSRYFEKVITLDAGPVPASLAALADTREWIGFVTDPKGHVTPTNEAAEAWLQMGIFDDLKKANQRSYQQIMASILGLSENGMRYILDLTEEEKARGRRHLEDLGVNLNRPVLGIHTGGGGRWKLKQWHGDRFRQLIDRIHQDRDSEVQVVLFGGPLEEELNRSILESTPAQVFDTGCRNELRHFAALVSGCDVMLSGDSLAMHVALATKCRVVVLFGPTSHTEIELFDLGEKTIPKLDCLCCYKTDCDFDPNCMDSISVEMVKAAVSRQLEKCDRAEKAAGGTSSS